MIVKGDVDADGELAEVRLDDLLASRVLACSFRDVESVLRHSAARSGLGQMDSLWRALHRVAIRSGRAEILRDERAVTYYTVRVESRVEACCTVTPLDVRSGAARVTAAS